MLMQLLDEPKAYLAFLLENKSKSYFFQSFRPLHWDSIFSQSKKQRN